MRVKEVSAVHIPDAPVGMVCSLPVLLGFTHQPPQDVLFLPLGLTAGRQIWLGCAIRQNLVLYHYCTQYISRQTEVECVAVRLVETCALEMTEYASDINC